VEDELVKEDSAAYPGWSPVSVLPLLLWVQDVSSLGEVETEGPV
jgi:hypothetical protein